MTGREAWMLSNPTMGTYQKTKMKKKRIRQVTTSKPMKILFRGRASKKASSAYSGSKNAISPEKRFRKPATVRMPVSFFGYVVRFRT
jgi:hypothetical protein